MPGYTHGYTLAENQPNNYPDTAESGEAYDAEAESEYLARRTIDNNGKQKLPEIEQRPDDGVKQS